MSSGPNYPESVMVRSWAAKASIVPALTHGPGTHTVTRSNPLCIARAIL